MSNLNFLHSGGDKVTLTTPASNPSTNPVFKLPAADGTAGQVLQTDGNGNLSWVTLPTAGVTMAEQWRLQSALQGNRTPLTGWNVVNTGNAGKIGSSMSESSGAFTFPSTGIYLIMFVLQGYSDTSTQNLIGVIQTTTNNSSWTGVSYSQNGIYDYSNSYPSHSNGMNTHIFDVENTSTHKVRFEYGAGQGGEYCDGHGSYTKTSATFVRLGDT